MKDDFFEERDEKNIQSMRDIVSELPSFCNEFFVGIATRTSPLTRLNYASDLRIFFDYLERVKFRSKVSVNEITLGDIETLEAFDIEAYLEYLTSYTFRGKKYTDGERGKERKLSSLRSFFKYYFKKDKLTKNITGKVDLPKIHQKPIIRLEPDEVVKILNQAENGELFEGRRHNYWKITKERDFALLMLLLGTGIRVSECVGLNRSDIHFPTNSFTVTRKGGDKSILYFSDEIGDALKKYFEWIDAMLQKKTVFSEKIKNTDALFLSVQGKRISVRAVELLVKKYSGLINPLKKITPHKLRSTYGTALYRETEDIYIVADVLGHKDINTTKKHYAAMSDEMRRKASRVVKLRQDTDPEQKE